MAGKHRYQQPMINKLLNLNKNGVQINFSWLPKLEKIIKKKFGLTKQISIALIDDDAIKQLNRVYRKKDKITDVLSFVIDSDYVLGEVLISVPQARRQARGKGQSYQSEFQLLTVHGILHLLGYDHEKSKLAAKHQAELEQRILEELNK